MAIVANLPTVDYAEGVHGVPWRRIFKIRNTVAWRWFYKFGQQIPAEEFMSAANEVIAESLLAFDPRGSGSLATFLFRAMNRRMPSVARQEWAGTIERTYAGAGKHLKVTSTTYKGPVFCDLPTDPALSDDGALPPPVPAALTLPSTQEATTYLRECLTYVGRHVNAREQVYLWHSVDGEEAAAIGHQYGVHKRVMQRTLKAVRDRLATWSAEASLAAAD